MAHQGDLLEEVRYGLEPERDATIAPRSVGAALLAGGVLGLATTLGLPGLRCRERGFAIAGSIASLGLGAIAIRAPLSLNGPARRAPVPISLACYGSAVASTALGGGDRAPAYFPAVLLTALGGGIGGDARTGRRAGVTVAVAYLVGCGMTLQPWRTPLKREVWWNVAGSFGFLGGGVVGSIVGELALKTRALTDYAEREVTVDRVEMEAAAADVRRLGRRFLELLPEVETAFSESPEMARATGEVATALASLRTARTFEVEETTQLDTLERLNEALLTFPWVR